MVPITSGKYRIEIRAPGTIEALIAWLDLTLDPPGMDVIAKFPGDEGLHRIPSASVELFDRTVDPEH